MNSRTIILVALSVAALSLSGCQSQDDSRVSNSAPSIGHSAPAGEPGTASTVDDPSATATTAAESGESEHTIGGPAADAAMKFKVKASLLTDSGIDTSKLDVEADSEGMVTLTGEVADEMTKQAAENAAKKVDGVKSVVNQLEAGQ